MGTAKIAYRYNGISEKEAFVFLVNGFTGQLKNWWDNALNFQSKEKILNHIINTEDQDGEIKETNDACDYLVVTISMYFMGNPRKEYKSSSIVLTNLKCPTLSDYRRYKDVFITQVLKRNDCNQAFWKERFIARVKRVLLLLGR